MKKGYYIFVLLLFLKLNSFSQGYDSIVLKTKLWCNLSGGLYDFSSVGAKECCKSTNFIKIDNDTIQNYKQVLKSIDSMKTWKKIGNIKEKDKKIYFKDSTNTEVLLYDFGVKVGDTIVYDYFDTTSFYTNYYIIQVINIDTVDYLGKNRKRIEVKRNLIHDYWIEGIGSINGILEPCSFVTGGFRELLCVFNNSTQIYQNLKRSSCFLCDYNVEFQELNSSKTFIYPSLTKGNITIDNFEKIIGSELIVFNVLGEIVQKQIILTKNIQINLAKGIYIFTIIDKNIIKIVQKIVIE